MSRKKLQPAFFDDLPGDDLDAEIDAEIDGAVDTAVDTTVAGGSIAGIAAGEGKDPTIGVMGATLDLENGSAGGEGSGDGGVAVNRKSSDPDTPLLSQLLNGKDEMNLAEFPIARLGRSDTRLSIEYKGQITDKLGNVIEQKWLVSGNATFGLPTEFADRVLVALMFITSQENLRDENPDRRVPFTIYRVIKLLGLSRNKRNYSAVEKALQQLVGVTIYSEGAFWDHQQQKRVTTKKGFHILEEFWLKSFGEEDEGDSEHFDMQESITGYVVWGERIWDSFQAGYIKNLDIHFYYSLENTLARRLFRFLDKRMHYQEIYQIDIFDLAARMGMKSYPFPSHLARKLKPAFDELLAQGFLARADIIKVGDFTRVRFVRASGTRQLVESSETDTEGPGSEISGSQAQSSTREDSDAFGAVFEPSHQGDEIWATVLEEFRRSLPPATYAMLASSRLLELELGHATIAVDPRYREWITRQMARQIKSLLNQHLTHEQRVRDVHFTSQAV